MKKENPFHQEGALTQHLGPFPPMHIEEHNLYTTHTPRHCHTQALRASRDRHCACFNFHKTNISQMAIWKGDLHFYFHEYCFVCTLDENRILQKK